MRFVCENCRAQYTIKDEKIKPQGVKVRCKKCSHVMTLRLPEADADELSDEATIRMPLPSEEDEETFFMDALIQSGEVPLSSVSFDEELTASSKPADLGSLFDDPELKAPSTSGFFGALDDEELGDAFERAISQRPAPSVQASAAITAAEPSIVISQGLSSPSSAEWFVAVEDNQVGPLDMRGMKTHWQQGKIGRDSLCWKSGMRDWLPISAVEGLFEQLNIIATSPPSIEFAPLPEAAPVEWKPSAASALASLVQDELQGLAASPPLGTSAGMETSPYAAAVSEAPLASSLPSASTPLPGAYSTIPPAPAPAYSTIPPVSAAAYAASLSMPPAPGTAAPAAIYLPPAAPASSANKAMWAIAAALLVLFLAVVGVLVVVLRGSQEAPPKVVQLPPPVQPQQVPTPPVPQPVVEVPPAPVQDFQVDSAQVLANQFAPPPKPKASSKAAAAPKTEAVAAAPATPTRSAGSNVQDDFEKVFGGGPAESAPSKNQTPKTVYVPPAPGAGAAKQSLSDADIMEYILSRRNEVATCAREQRAKNANVKGNMVMEWNIATSGRTSQVRLASPTTFQGTHFADCVTKLIQSWQFPAHRTAGGTRKFNFKI